ncbi:MAG: flagellar basal-body rod protein FlgG [Sneathiellaceae bacterium]|uniref:flagellar basal-body rod protein FlgG n=1 Tax=Marinovum algicola TaxID=42444 RepID=UPI0032EABADC
MRSLSIGSTGMLAQQLNVEVISNNIANMTTTGFKRQRAEFQDLLYQNLRRSGSQSSDSGTVVPAGIQIGVGVRTSAVYRIFEQGNLEMTENSLDLAINGRGFFQITLPDGSTAYTRSGTFAVSSAGQIVTQDGYTLQPGITIPQNATAISINSTGEVSVKVPGSVAENVVGQINLAIFFNDAGLESMGDNLFLETAASGTATTGTAATNGFGALRQGYLETSNVNPVQEITNLIKAQRAYEMNSRVISTSDEMMAATSQLK